jgi:predicted transposase/invertase (TIGR01784 family)
MNREEYEKYQESLIGYWESIGMIETARLEGKAEGKAEGKIEGKLEIALSAIKMGMTDEIIVNLTGLSIEEIQRLRVV